MSVLDTKTKLTRHLEKASRGLIVIVIGAGLSGAASLVLARILSVEQYGIYIFAIMVLNYGVVVARGGMDSSAVRYVNQYLAEGQRNLVRGFVGWANKAILVVSVVVGVLAGLLAVPLSIIRPDVELAALLGAIAGLVPLSLVFLHSALLRAEKKIVISQLPVYVCRPLLLLLLGALVWWGGYASGAAFVWAEVVGIIIIAVPLSRLTRHLRAGGMTDHGQEDRTDEWRRTTRGLTVAAVTTQLIGQVDIIMVGVSIGMAEAGIYGLASRLAKLVMLGYRAADSIAAPMIAESFHADDKETLQALVSQTASLMTASTILLSAGLVLVPDSVFEWLGEGYVEARSVLAVMLVGKVLNAVTGPVGALLNMTGREAYQTAINVLAGGGLIAGIIVAAMFGGTILHIAVLYSAAMVLCNFGKAFVVYREFNINSFPAIRRWL